MHSRQIRTPQIAALLVVALAAALRLYRLGHESLWLDEARSWSYVTRQYTMPELLFELPMADPHPPLYYLFLDGWVALAGTSEVALRFPSVVFGVATVALCYLLGARLVDRWTGVAAATLVAVSSFHVYHSQSARMYSLFAALTLVSMYFFVDLTDDDEPDRNAVVGYVLATILMGYTHVFGLFVILAQGIYAVLRVTLATDRWPGPVLFDSSSLTLRSWLIVESTVAILLGPWLLALFARVFTRDVSERTGWIPAPDLLTLPGTVYTYFFQFGVDPAGLVEVAGLDVGLAVPLALVLAAWGVFSREDATTAPRVPDAKTVLLVVWFLTSIVVPFVISVTLTPILVARYTIAASIPLFLLIGKSVQGLGSGESSSVRPLIGAVLVCVLVVNMAAPLPTYYAEDQREQWREAVQTVESTAASDDVVLVAEALTPYEYYSTRSDLRATGLTGTAEFDRTRRAVDGHGTVWLVLSHTDGDRLHDHLERLGYEVVATHEYRNVAVYRFRRAD